MASPQLLKRIAALTWVLIFGGLLTLIYGLTLERYAPEAGWSFVVGGGVAAAIGALLIVLRARLPQDPPRR